MLYICDKFNVLSLIFKIIAYFFNVLMLSRTIYGELTLSSGIDCLEKLIIHTSNRQPFIDGTDKVVFIHILI